MVRRAERAVAKLGKSLGLSPIRQDASRIRYFREYPHFGFPLRFAAGEVGGHGVEICFIPIIKRSGVGKTMLGIRAAKTLPAGVGLSARDAVSPLVYSLFGRPNATGSRPLFDGYDAWGSAEDIGRFFTPEMQAKISSFPYRFDLLTSADGEGILLVWRGIEDDVGIMEQAVRIGAALCDSA